MAQGARRSHQLVGRQLGRPEAYSGSTAPVGTYYLLAHSACRHATRKHTACYGVAVVASSVARLLEVR